MALRYDSWGTPQSSQIALLRMAGTASSVLDVGCATGNFGMQLHAKNPDVFLVGIEYDMESREIARQKEVYHEILDVDLNGDFALPDGCIGRFERIVLGDVLEHLFDAGRTLERLRRYLAPGGKFLISLPNVTNFEVIERLLSGTAEYTDNGLLDRTHMHFYNWHEVCLLANGQHMQIGDVSATYTNLHYIRRFSQQLPECASEYLFRHNPLACVFQFLFSLSAADGVPSEQLRMINERAVEVIHDRPNDEESKFNKLTFEYGCLYYRTEHESFAEEKKIIFKAFAINGILQVDISLDEIPQENTHFRFDFGEKTRVYHLQHFVWLDQDGNELEAVDDYSSLGMGDPKFDSRGERLLMMLGGESFLVFTRKDARFAGVRVACYYCVSPIFNTQLEAFDVEELLWQKSLTGFQDQLENHALTPDRVEALLTALFSSQQRLSGKKCPLVSDLERGQCQLETTSQQLESSTHQLESARQKLTSTTQKMASANQQLESTTQQLESTTQQLESTTQQLASANQQLASANQQLETVQNSFCWRMTAPLRRSLDHAKTIRHRLSMIVHSSCSFAKRMLWRIRKFNRHDFVDALSARYPKATIRLRCRCCRDKVLIIDHNLGGGANCYRDMRIREWIASGSMSILLHNNIEWHRHTGYQLRFRRQDWEAAISFDKLEDVFKFLHSCKVTDVVYNSLVFYPECFAVLSWMKRGKFKINILLHDFFSLCPSYTLIDDDGKFCNLERDCNHCLPAMKLVHYPDVDFDIAEWRSAWLDVLNLASEIRVFSESSKRYFLKIYPTLEPLVRVIPHSMDGYTAPSIKLDAGDRPVIGVIGGICSLGKGCRVVEELADAMAPEKLYVIGDYSGHPRDNLEVTGTFTTDTLPVFLKRTRVNILLIPSVCPETFSYLASELMMGNLPLLSFNLGAQGDKVAAYRYGRVVPEMNAQSVLRSARELYDVYYGKDIL